MYIHFILEEIMNSIIRAWGNSQGLYIPKATLKQVGLEVNDAVEISVEGDAIMVRKDKTLEKRIEALENLRALRASVLEHEAESSVSTDYKKELEEYFDEKYGI